jgi:hypothetical protein
MWGQLPVELHCGNVHPTGPRTKHNISVEDEDEDQQREP